jgi:hypothetical protein
MFGAQATNMGARSGTAPRAVQYRAAVGATMRTTALNPLALRERVRVRVGAHPRDNRENADWPAQMDLRRSAFLADVQVDAETSLPARRRASEAREKWKACYRRSPE